MDIMLSLAGLVVLLPVFLIVAAVIYWRMGAPVLFVQMRPGLGGKPFALVKFRTMLHTIDHTGNLRPDSERMTPLGQFLRATSLDELPELWCVLKGDMALVGPRPLLIEYLPLYTPEQARRHNVRPGITGWAQINGRNSISWEDRLALDVWYVENRSIWLDLRILALTVWKVIRREGISAKGEATMPKFSGRIDEKLNVTSDHLRTGD